MIKLILPAIALALVAFPVSAKGYARNRVRFADVGPANVDNSTNYKVKLTSGNKIFYSGEAQIRSRIIRTNSTKERTGGRCWSNRHYSV